MARPIKWTRDLYPIRDGVIRSRIETWSRQEIERLFDISRASAQSLMKAIGGVQTVGAAHFVDRASLLLFLDEMIDAGSVETALRTRTEKAEPPPRRRPIRVPLPAELRLRMLPDLPGNITLGPGRLEIRAGSAEHMLESLAILATILQNDLARCQAAIERKAAAPTGPDDTSLPSWPAPGA